MGAIERNIARQAIRAGEPIPERIQNAPVLTEGLQLYLDAFFDLDSERSHAVGITPIPWTSIRSYAEAYDFDEDQTEDCFFFVKRMDAENMKRLERKRGKGGTDSS